MPIYLIAHRKLENDSRVPRKARMIWKKNSYTQKRYFACPNIIEINCVFFFLFLVSPCYVFHHKVEVL